MTQGIKQLVVSQKFQTGYKILGVLFIILTYFISVSPNSFLKFGYIGVAVFNMISSGLIVMPILVKKLNLFGVILSSSLGNAVNTSINYLVGYSSSSMFSGNSAVNWLKDCMKKYGLVAVFILAIIPLPLDVNGLLSGYLGFSYKRYILVNFLGKVVVFFLVGLGILTLPKFLNK